MSATDKMKLVERAQEVAQSGVINELLDQADSILDRLVGKYAGGTLTDREAAIGISTIAELRRAAARGTRDLTKGIDAGHSLTRSAA